MLTLKELRTRRTSADAGPVARAILAVFLGNVIVEFVKFEFVNLNEWEKIVIVRHYNTPFLKEHGNKTKNGCDEQERKENDTNFHILFLLLFGVYPFP